MSSATVYRLSYDEFVETGTDYKAFRAKMLERIEEFIGQYKSRRNPVVLIVDDNMTLRSMRREVLSLARKHRLGYFQVWFRISLEKALERNRSRPEAVSEDIVANLWSRIEDPSKDSSVETLTIAVDEDQRLDCEEFREKVIQHLNNPEKTPDLPKREKVEHSELHKIDLILRQEVSRRLREASDRETVRILADALNSRRKTALKTLRNASQLPESLDDVRNLLDRDCTNGSVE
ncbi:uncharacterized protein LOC132264856 [Phlebotomus argentipes]|uniref:uncharacterized protein LOC132264856 n=1 Tax=Phlebotomus argentipes TaxID=94469 RepID=UPI0028930C9C|nr:uncharacterized protein LOC132264856 [Phlebotomus argentipes]